MFYTIARNCLVFLLVCLAALYGFYLAGFRVNVSESMPVGIWRIQKLNRSLKRGDIVWFCPPDTKIFQMAKQRGYIPSGSCLGGYAHLIKKVVAIPGDTVKLTSEGLWVNGALLPNSKPKLVDQLGFKLLSIKTKDRVVPERNVWVLGQHPASFDSRYVASVPITYDLALAIPVLW